MSRRALSFFALFFTAHALARAQSRELTILSPPAPPELSPSAPSMDAPADLHAFEQKTIDSVEVEVIRDGLPADPDPVVTRVKPGMTFTPRLARIALDEVLSSGTVGDARATVTFAGVGVKLKIIAVARVLVDSLRIDAGDAEFDSDDLARDAQIQEGDEVLASELPTRKRRMEVYLARAGYPSAEVKIEARDTDRRGRASLLVTIKPGKPRKVERRVFYAVDAARKDVEPFTADYLVKIGDRVQETNLDSADVDLERRLRAAGWHEASVTHDVVLASDLVTVRVRVDAGPRYVALFRGNLRYDNHTLQGALGIETETDFSPPHLLDKIKTFYKNRGFLDTEITLDVELDAKKHERYLTFHVFERDRVLVAERSYPCLREQDVASLSGGGPTSARAIGREIDSFLEEDLPGTDLFINPDPQVVRRLFEEAPKVKAPAPVDLNPATVYAPDSYDRAVSHVQDLYRNEGYLAALVGPVQVIRRHCAKGSLPGKCIPVETPPDRADVCAYDAARLPIPPPPVDPSQSCVPDPQRGVLCEDRLALRIPVKLGPRTMLYDAAFSGVRALEESRLLKASELVFGDYVSQIKLEEGRRKIVELYKEEGFFYVDVKYAIEKSPDSTRARVRFDITEGERVIVRRIIIRGNRATRESVIKRRVAFFEGQPYRTSDVQKTQERISTLGVFTSVNVALANPYVPTKDKSVIVTVIERNSQYLELRPGISTGEGIRGAVEYGHRNLFGYAISFTTRLQASYLPVLAFPDLYAQGNPGLIDRFRRLEQFDNFPAIAIRFNAGIGLPDLGLGPLFRSQIDLVAYRDIQRDFRLFKAAFIPSIQWTPSRGVRFSLSPTVELNDVFVYGGTEQGYCDLVSQPGNSFILRVPEGRSVVGAGRLLAIWDRRDQPLSAHSGTYFAAGAEIAGSRSVGQSSSSSCGISSNGLFLKLTQTIGGYIPLTKRITLALLLRLGEIVQLEKDSTTYPDRLFYMGGFDSMRGWAQDTFIPQDVVDAIDDPVNQAKADNDPTKLTATRVPLRGGDLMVNPRVELRFPLTGAFDTVIFGDFGNLWRRLSYPFDRGAFPLRVAVGSGVRLQTPVGPLALDYGINLTRLPYEDFGALSFSVGLF